MSNNRIEDILQAIIDGADVSQFPPPQSRNEALLLQILDKINGMSGEISLPIHICSTGEYDPTTGMPTVSAPEPETFYLVPSSEAETNNLFVEWVYVEGAWEKFFEVKAEIPQSDLERIEATINAANAATSAANSAASAADTATQRANSATTGAVSATTAANAAAEDATEAAEAARAALEENLGGLSFAVNPVDHGIDITYTY